MVLPGRVVVVASDRGRQARHGDDAGPQSCHGGPPAGSRVVVFGLSLAQSDDADDDREAEPPRRGNHDQEDGIRAGLGQRQAAGVVELALRDDELLQPREERSGQ